jgi:hypothetical protein
MKFQVQTSYYNFNKYGHPKSIKVGTILTQKEYNQLTQLKKNKCIQHVVDRSPLSMDEINPVVDEYLSCFSDSGTPIKTFDRYAASVGMKSFRNDPIASTMAVFGQLVFVDNFNTEHKKCLDRRGQTLSNILKTYNLVNNVERFDV